METRKKNTEALADDDYLNLTYADQLWGLKTFRNISYEYSFLVPNSQRYFSQSKDDPRVIIANSNRNLKQLTYHERK